MRRLRNFSYALLLFPERQRQFADDACVGWAVSCGTAFARAVAADRRCRSQSRESLNIFKNHVAKRGHRPSSHPARTAAGSALVTSIPVAAKWRC